MKNSTLLTFVVIGLALTLGSTGCKKRLGRTTPLPGMGRTGIDSPGPRGEIDAGQSFATPLGQGDVVPLTNQDSIDDREQDRSIFAANTVYFDFDQSTVRGSEADKIASVAARFKSGFAGHDILIEGHCDDRGTDEYNRSLGERRALALREYLVRLGVSPAQLHTKSFGEDTPAVEGRDESAWSKNRRGEFILVLPRR